MDKDKLSELETGIDGIEFALTDALLTIQLGLRKLGELKEILQDKPKGEDIF